MSKQDKPVAKSLHTVTVIVQVARLYMANGNKRDEALAQAMETLGLAGRDDPYGLAAAALKQL